MLNFFFFPSLSLSLNVISDPILSIILEAIRLHRRQTDKHQQLDGKEEDDDPILVSGETLKYIEASDTAALPN